MKSHLWAIQRGGLIAIVVIAIAIPRAIGGGGGGGGGGGSTTTTTTTTTTTSTSTTSTTTTTTTSTTTTTVPVGAQKRFSIISVGTVKGSTKTVTMEAIQRKTWAKYALWSNDNGAIYFKSGEKFYGHVHANSPLYFSGDPEFFDFCTSASTNYVGSTNAVTFHKGLSLGVETDTMADVNFATLQTKAGLVLTGATDIVLSGTNLIINNAQRGWTNSTNAVANSPVVYVVHAGGTTNGDINIRGELQGRCTLVAERDVNIMNHVTYASDPATNAASGDALGIITKRDIVVSTAAPNDLKIYAHMLATGQYDTNSVTDGSFGVQNYASRAPSGSLRVYGGIVQDKRGAVGTFSGSNLTSGFDKNYTYDTRFALDPPPEYPPLSNELVFEAWRDK